MNKLKAKLAHLISECEAEGDRMQNIYDNRSEKWQDGDKGEEYSEKMERLNDGIAELDSALVNFDTIF